MTTSDRQDDARRTGDALDRLIDEAVESALRAGPVDLRSQVLAGLDGGPTAFARDAALEESPRDNSEGWFRRVVAMPALLPVAGALVMIAGVGILWQHADQQLGQATSRRGPANSAQAGAPTAPDRPVAQMALAEPAAMPPRPCPWAAPAARGAGGKGAGVARVGQRCRRSWTPRHCWPPPISNNQNFPGRRSAISGTRSRRCPSRAPS